MSRIRTFGSQFTLPGATSTNAITLNGTTQYGVLSAAYAALNALTDFTIEFWMNESNSNPNFTSWWELDAGTTGLAAGYNDNSNANVTGQVNTPTTAFTGNTSSQWTPGTFVHVGMIWDSVNKIVTNVINGNQISSTFNQNGVGTLPDFTNALLYLGTASRAADFIGSFACTRIWNRQRAVSDIKATKNYYLDPTRESGLILNLNFIEASGITVANTVPGGASMNLVGNPSWSVGPTLNTWVYPVRTVAGPRTLAGVRTLAA